MDRQELQSFFQIERLEDDTGRQQQLAASVKRKLDRHVVSWLWCLAVLCYLDRSNLSYAAVPLLKDLRISCSTYGLGAGAFFVSYALFQVPSNLALTRLGAPLWLSIIAVAWGAVAMLFSAAGGTSSFLALRFALGMAECGAFPGFWYHLTQFYSERELGPAYSKVASSTALAQVLGGPIAAALLSLDGLGGLQGWRWLFLAEGAATVGFAALLLRRLPHSPARSTFLSAEERCWLERRQEAARAEKGDRDGRRCGGMLDWRILYLGVTWMAIAAAMFGLVFWIPIIISSVLTGEVGAGGHAARVCNDSGAVAGAGGQLAAPAQEAAPVQVQSPAVVALLSAVPFAAAAGAMLWNAQRAEAANERHRHAGLPILLAGAALGLVPPLLAGAGAAPAFLALVVAVASAWSFHGPFFSWPAVFLQGPDAAAAFAFINSLGAVGGFCGPVLIGVLSEREAGLGLAMQGLAAVLLVAGAALLGELGWLER